MARGSRGLACFVALGLVLGLCAGCGFPWWDPIREDLVGPYVLIAIEESENLSVFYDTGKSVVGRIGPTVIDVGWDDRYIVAAQRDRHEPGGPLSYYYLEIGNDSPYSGFQAVTGPLTEEEFETAKAELDLPDFTLHYPELR